MGDRRELAVSLRLVHRPQPVVVLGEVEPTLVNGAPQDTRDALPVGIGSPHVGANVALRVIRRWTSHVFEGTSGATGWLSTDRRTPTLISP